MGASNGDHAVEIAEAIVRACSGRVEGPDGRMPTERALAEMLGIGRTSVRRGLAALEAQGRITRHVGRGTYLRETTELSAFVAEEDGDEGNVGPAGLMAVREALEPSLLPLAAVAATASDFREMDRCLRGGATATTRDEFEAWDFALHHAIVASTHNPLLVGMYQDVEAARHGQVWGSLKRRQDSTARRRAYQEDHRAIVEALKAREAAVAVKAMTLHLERVSVVLFGRADEPGAARPDGHS